MMARTHAAYSDERAAKSDARARQREAPLGHIVTVEHDAYKEPDPYRVVSFDLADKHDRRSIVRPGEYRVTGVRCTFHAVRVVDLTAPEPVIAPARGGYRHGKRAPAPLPELASVPAGDLIGQYRAERKIKRRRRKAA